jgi:hypothetical protein
MSVLHSLELGILGGIALFYVLMYSGLLDKWFR